MTSTLRVLQCIARVNAGGTATLIDGLMREMDAPVRQLLVHGVCEAGEVDYFADHPPTYPTLLIPSLSRSINLRRDLKSFLALRRVTKEFQPDIIHTHTFKAGVIGRAVALSLRIRPIVVHTFHGHLLTGYFSKPVTTLIRFLEKLLAKYTNVILTVGPRVTQDLLNAGVGNKKQYREILPGVTKPQKVDRHTARSTLNLHQELFTIGFIGRLTSIKRVDRFIDALGLIDIPYQALIAGDGEDRKAAEERAKELQPNVIFLGWRDDIDIVLSACDVVVLTSDNEGSPLVLIEAQLRGVTVVATNVGSVSAALKANQTGFLVGATAEEVADGIMKVALLSPLEREKMAYEAMAFAEANFTMKRFAEQHHDLYLSLVN